MSASYVIWSNEHEAWWAPAERGYTPILEEAGRYDLAAARRIVAEATVDGHLKPIRQSHLKYGTVETVNEVMLLAPEWTPQSEAVDDDPPHIESE
jgi:hypothetical protein